MLQKVPGDFIAVAEGQVFRFQAAYVSPDEAAEVVAALWRGGVPRLEPGSPAAVEPEWVRV